MKSFVLLFVLLATGVLARAESFLADRHCDGVAGVLQGKIPELAFDRLFEARRGNAEWHYAFWTKIEKTWVEEIRITIRAKTASTSEVEVAVFRIEGGSVKAAAKPQPLADAAWTARIRALVAQ